MSKFFSVLAVVIVIGPLAWFAMRARASRAHGKTAMATPATRAPYTRPSYELSAGREAERQVLLHALDALRIKMEVHCDNLANLHTIGFKRCTVATRAEGAGRKGVGLGCGIGPVVRDFANGPLEYTGRSLDVALEGAGFFQVQLHDGSTGYTRGGRLRVDAGGKVTTATGFLLLPAITLPRDLLDVAIGRDGRVTGRTGGSPDTTTAFGQLQLARFVAPSGLRRQAEGVYTEVPASGAAAFGSPGDAGFATIRQGFLERSNVERAREVRELRRTEENHALLEQLVSQR